MKTDVWCFIEKSRWGWLLAQTWLLLYMGIIIAGGSWSTRDPNLFTSFYVSFSTVVLGLLCCVCRRHVKGPHVSLVGCLAGLVLLLFYLLLWKFRPEIIREVCTCVLLFGVGMTVASKPSFRQGLYAALAGWAVLMACYGLLQLCGLFINAGEVSSPERMTHVHLVWWNPFTWSGDTFPLKGVFDNPAGLGMFLALLFPYVLECCRASRGGRWLIVLVGAVLVLSGSRTGVLATAVAAYVYFYPSLSRRWRIVLPVAGIVLLVGLYFCRPVSANGRMFVAYITSRLAVEHPLTGSGPFGFEVGYMQEQAAYFTAHPASPWIYVADDMKQPFNEYLHFFLRFGLVGLGWAACLLYLIYKRCKRTYDRSKRPALASLAAVSVCACFSYPAYYPLIGLLVVTALSVMCAGGRSYAVTLRWQLGLIIVFSLGLCGLSATQFFQERARLVLEQRAESGEQTEALLQAYEALSRTARFRVHPSFIYNHALFLYECGHYEACLSALKRCSPYKQDYDWQMLYAYTQLHLGRKEAETAFLQASCMLPARLQPRYELVRLYDRMGRQEDALRCAREAMALPMKVKNVRTEYLRRWIQRYEADRTPLSFP